MDDSKSDKASQDSGQGILIVKTNVWRKIDYRVLPVVSMMLLLAFLDRSNVGNARVAGLQKDLHMTNKQYSTALTVTYVPLMLVMIPANLLLERIGADVLLSTITILFGFVSMMEGFVRTYSGLIACRFFLGVAAGGLLPCVSLYLSSFYPRYKLQLRISIYFSTSSFTGAFSGLLAAAITNMDGLGGRPGWAWIFILEGLFTILFGILSFWILPRSASDAKFLTSEEKAFINEKLQEDGIVARNSADDDFAWRDILKTYTRPTVFLMVLGCFFNGTTETGLAYFEPSIVQGLGYTANHAQLMSVPPFAVTFVLSLATGFLSDKYHCRGFTVILFTLMAVAGFSVFLGTNSNAVRYGSLFLSLPGSYCPAPPLAAWTANNAAPYTRRAVALASLTVMTGAGGILSTWLLGSLSPAPKYTKAAITFIVFSILQIGCAAANLMYCMAQNRKKKERRAVGTVQDEKKGLGDQSAWFVYSY